MSIYDTMQFIKPDVSTICMGQAASMGAFLLTAGAKGKRFCLPNSRVMIHQPLGGYQGQATDIEIHAREILKVKGRMNELMAHHTGQSLEQIERDTERDRFLSAAEAVEYGLVDSILTHRTDAQGARVPLYASSFSPRLCERLAFIRPLVWRACGRWLRYRLDVARRILCIY